jgi:hypothetical protein
MNTINVSNPTLNNILTILNAGQNTNKPKKRPTFNEVFNKISKRTENLKSTKQPLNNILTNDQLFRFYIQDTQPLLQKSNDTFNEGNNNLIQSLTSSQPSQNKTYGVADIGNTNEPSNVVASRDYVDNPDNPPPAPDLSTIPVDDMTDDQKLQFAYDNSLNILKFFDSLNMEGNNSVETGTLINAMLMRDAMTDGWRSFGYDLFNDLQRKGILENVIGELYTIMTRANAENPDTYEQISNTLYNIMRVDVDGLSKDELEAEIFRYIQNPPAMYGYARGKSYEGELAKYQASVSRTPSKIVEGILTDIKTQIQSKSTKVADETPTPELKDPATIAPRPERTDEDIFKAQAGQVIRGMIDSLFQDDATANEVDIEPFTGFESFDFTPMRVSELLLKVPSFMDYEKLPENIKSFYAPPEDKQPREVAISLPSITPPSNLKVATDSVIEERRRGGGRPKGSRNKDTIRREAEMRTLLLDEVRRDNPNNPTFQVPDDELEDIINSLFS